MVDYGFGLVMSTTYVDCLPVLSSLPPSSPLASAAAPPAKTATSRTGFAMTRCCCSTAAELARVGVPGCVGRGRLVRPGWLTVPVWASAA